MHIQANIRVAHMLASFAESSQTRSSCRPLERERERDLVKRLHWLVNLQHLAGLLLVLVSLMLELRLPRDFKLPARSAAPD